MIDGVSAVLVGYPLRINSKVLLHRIDLCRRRSSERNDGGWKQLGIPRQFFGCIAFRVDSGEDDVEGVIALAEFLAQLDKTRERCRADIGQCVKPKKMTWGRPARRSLENRDPSEAVKRERRAHFHLARCG